MYEQLKVKINERRKLFFQSENRMAANSDAPGRMTLELSVETKIFPGWVSLTAGGLARLLAVTIVSPLELVRYILTLIR